MKSTPFRARCGTVATSPRRARREHRRQQHENGDSQQVLEDEPADRHLAVRRVEPAVVHQAAHEHHRAGDGNRDAKHPGAGRREAPDPAESVADRRDDQPSEERARNGNPPHPPEIAKREMQPDAEHQQDDAELGELTDGLSSPRNPGVNGPSATPATM